MLTTVDTKPSLGDLGPEALRELAVRIRRARRDAGLSQSELAVELGLGQSTISRLERGEAAVRRWQIEAIAKRLNVGLDWLLYGSSGPDADADRNTKAQAEQQAAASEPGGFVRQYLVCPVCGQDALTPTGIFEHLLQRCSQAHTEAQARELAPQATVDPQPWAYVLARYEQQLDAARQAARFRLRGRAHWRRLVRIIRTARDRMLQQGPDHFEIRNPHLDDPYWIPSDLSRPDWAQVLRSPVSDEELDAELDELDREAGASDEPSS